MPRRKAPASSSDAPATPARVSGRVRRAPTQADDNYQDSPATKRRKIDTHDSDDDSSKVTKKKTSKKSAKKAKSRSLSRSPSRSRSRSRSASPAPAPRKRAASKTQKPSATEKTKKQKKEKKKEKEKKEEEVEDDKDDDEAMEEEDEEEEAMNPIPTVTGQGVLLSFGSGDMSQLGLGDAENMRERKKPTLIQNALASLSVVSVAAGSLHNAALTADGSVYTWGCNDDSALGHEHDEWLPTKVVFPGKTKIAAIACGASHTIALSTSGVVYTWGTYRDAAGVMGFNAKLDVAKTPIEMSINAPVVAIACGENHDLALTKKGDVFAWGDVGIGQRSSDRVKKGKLQPRRVLFSKVGTYAKPKIAHVFAGGSTNFAIDTKGNVWAWGPNNYHQCGLPNQGKSLSITAPTPIPQLSSITSVACSTHHALFLTQDGHVWSAGRGEYGRLGHGDNKERESPEKIPSLPASSTDPVTWIGVGESHSLAVTKSGQLYTWGYGDLLQLGTGVEEDVTSPTLVSGQQLANRHIIQATGGSQHSIVLATQTPATNTTATATATSTSTSTSTSTTTSTAPTSTPSRSSAPVVDTEQSVAPAPIADYVPPPAQ